ncbi:PspC domain-containing protein, partial [Dietzia sp. B19]
MSSTSTHDVPSELRSLWRTRPVRTPDDAKIAGVCGGFGRRYGVDPVLFRIAFVIAALWGGAGVFLYALMWLLLRSAGDEVSKGEALIGKGRASGSRITAAVLVVVVLLSAPTFGGSGESLVVGAGFLMGVAMLAGWYGLHRRTPVPPTGWSEVSAVRPRSTRAGTSRAAGA